MAPDINVTLIGIEKRLGSLGLPAGPDNLINHKALLGLFFGALGAFIGWLITEPYNENFTFFRDFLILTVVGFMICFFITLADVVFDKTLSAFTKALVTSLLSALIIIAPSAILAKFLFSSDHAFSNLLGASENPVQILVLDVSTSMKGYPLETLRKAVRTYAEVIDKNDVAKRIRVACVVFSDHAQIISEPTTEVWRVVNQIDTISTCDCTNMADGLLLAQNIVLKLLADKKSGPLGNRLSSGKDEQRPYEVILVTDGEPNTPRSVEYATQAVMERLNFFASNRCPVHTVGAGNEYNKTLLENIAFRTGGQFVPANNVAELVPVMATFARQGLAQAGGPSNEQKIGPIARMAGWIIIGVAIGVCATLPRKSLRAILLGSIGGLVGGLIGALLFELIQYVMALGGAGSGLVSRCLGFVFLGASVGFAVPFVESVGKPAWIRIIQGGQSGRIAVLDKSPMILGSGLKADIRIVGDMAIEAKHIRFTRAGEDQDIESLGKRGFLVNGKMLRKTRIRHQDAVLVGATQFVYISKLTGFGIQRSGFEKLNLKKYR